MKLSQLSRPTDWTPADEEFHQWLINSLDDPDTDELRSLLAKFYQLSKRLCEKEVQDEG